MFFGFSATGSGLSIAAGPNIHKCSQIKGEGPVYLRFMLIVSTGQRQAEVTKGHDVLSAYEYCVSHVSGITSVVETNRGLVIFGFGLNYRLLRQMRQKIKF